MKKSNFKKNHEETPCLSLSLLDKLIDHSPEKNLDPVLSPIQQLQQFYEGLQRDLENLLNTRLGYFVNDENLTQLKTSLYSYGMPHFVSNHWEDKAGLAKFCNTLTEYIKQFEPRFKTVTVLPILNPQNKQSLQLRIQGTLHGEFLANDVVFNSFLEDQTQAFTLEKGN